MNEYQSLFHYGREILNMKRNLWPNMPNKLPDKLLQALYDGDANVFKEVIDSGLNVNISDKRGVSLIHLAVLTDNNEILDILLQQPKINLNVQSMGETPLCLGIILKCSESIILSLIEAGADVTIPNDDLKTPLHLAIMNCSVVISKALIKHGADINAPDFDGNTPLHEAVECREPVQMIQMLLYYGADANAKCYDNLTPFMKALSSYNASMELLEYEADFNNISTDDAQLSSLLIAVGSENPIAFEIIRRGGDVNYIAPCGYHALERSIFWKDPSMFRELWLKMDKKLIINSRTPFLSLYVSGFCRFDTKDWLECLYEMLESDIAFDLVDSYVSKTQLSFKYIIDEFEKRKVSKDDRLKLIYTFLTFSAPVQINDVFRMYHNYGFNEEVEAVLFMDIESDSLSVVNRSLLIPHLITNTNMDVNDIIIAFIQDYVPDFNFQTFLKEILLMFRFCTPTAQFGEEYYRRVLVEVVFDEELNDENGWEGGNSIIKEFNYAILNKLGQNRVPSLLELSRNAARGFINGKCNRKDVSEFQTILTSLELPKRLKDIVRFKVPLYND